MASNATESGQAFQGFLVPESGLTYEYSGTTANLEWASPEVASGYAEPTAALIPSGEPTGLTAGQSVYLVPVRGGAPGPDGCSYMWSVAASYSAAVSAGDWRGWDAPTTVRWSRCLDSTGVLGRPAIAARSDGTALAFWSKSGTPETIRYAEFDGDSWDSYVVLLTDSTPLPLWPAACTLADDVVALFHLVESVADAAQVNAYFIPTQGSAVPAKSVLATPVDVSTGPTGIVCAASGLNVVLFVSAIVSATDTVYQYASTDGGRSFDLVETWAADRVIVAVTATPSGFVVLADREVTAGSWRHEAIKLGSAFEPASSASATVLWDARRGASQSFGSVLVHDPIGATWILREPADPSTDVADQAVSYDEGATWIELAGGLQSALGGRGWLSGRTALLESSSAAWVQDRAIVVAVGATSSAVVAMHLGGAARRPMPGSYADQGQTLGTYGGRLMWSSSYIATGDDPLGSSGWSTSDTGTVTRTYEESPAGPYALTETFGASEATQHQRSIDNDGAEVVLRYVVSTSVGTAEVIGQVVSDGTVKAQLDVRYETGTGAWSYRDRGAGTSWTSLGTATATTQAYEVIIAVDSVSLRGRLVVRPWKEPHNGDGATTYTVALAMTSTATAGNSSATLNVTNVSVGLSVFWSHVDVAFTSTAANLSAATEPTVLGRPLSAEVATWLGRGLSLQAVGGVVTGSARYVIAQSSSTGAANLDPASVPSPRRYFETTDVNYTETITITRTEAYRTGWTSDLYGLHFEGIDGFESLSIELYDDADDAWRSLGTLFCSSESLNWSRRGSVVTPRESGSAGNALWLDRNELAGRGSWRFASAYVAPVAENSSGTWVAGSTIAERRPFIRVDASGLADEFSGYDTYGTSGYIRYPNLTVLFQPAVIAAATGGLDVGFSKVRVTIAANGATTDGVFDITRRIRKVAMGPVVVMPRELTRTGAHVEAPSIERVAYPDGDVLVVRRGPRSETIELSHSHSHAPMRYDRWGSAATAPGYLQAAGSGARPLATAEDVVGVLRGLWDDADDGAKPLVWLPYIDSAASSWSLTGVRSGIYGMVTGAHRRANVVGRPDYSAEAKVDAFTFERLTWVRE